MLNSIKVGGWVGEPGGCGQAGGYGRYCPAARVLRFMSPPESEPIWAQTAMIFEFSLIPPTGFNLH